MMFFEQLILDKKNLLILKWNMKRFTSLSKYKKQQIPKSSYSIVSSLQRAF